MSPTEQVEKNIFIIFLLLFIIYFFYEAVSTLGATAPNSAVFPTSLNPNVELINNLGCHRLEKWSYEEK